VVKRREDGRTGGREDWRTGRREDGKADDPEASLFCNTFAGARTWKNKKSIGSDRYIKFLYLE
jgi:hypothetical protein